MSIEALRNDPTAKQLVELLYPDKLTLSEAFAQGEARGEALGMENGIKEGIKRATEDFVRQFRHVLGEEQIQQFLTKEYEKMAPAGKSI